MSPLLEDDNATERKSGQWGRYSLRFALLVFTVFCLVVGSVGRRVYFQRSVVSRLDTDPLAKYFFDYEYTGGRRDLDARIPGPVWLRSIVGDDWFRSLFSVNLGGLSDDQELVMMVGRLKGLERITLPNVQDDALHQLPKLPNLKSVDVSGAKLTDSGIATLAECELVESISFTDCRSITPKGLEFLIPMRNLRTLYFYGTPIGSAGLAVLTRIPQLGTLSIQADWTMEIDDDEIANMFPNTDLEF